MSDPSAHPTQSSAAPQRRNVPISLTINGELAEVSFRPEKTLLEVLREDLSLTGTKHGCELGECGACAVLLDGEPVLSCLVLALECAGRDVLTVEGLAGGPGLHPLQAAFCDLGATQCGYCTPGILCTAKALLDRDPAPSRATIAVELSGNLCRCTGYAQIVDAVEEAARRLRAPAAHPDHDRGAQPPPGESALMQPAASAHGGQP